MPRPSPIETTGLTPEQAKAAYKEYRKDYQKQYRLKNNPNTRPPKNLSSLSPKERRKYNADYMRDWLLKNPRTETPEAAAKRRERQNSRYIKKAQPQMARTKEEIKAQKRITRIASYRKARELAGKEYMPQAIRSANKAAKAVEVAKEAKAKVAAKPIMKQMKVGRKAEPVAPAKVMIKRDDSGRVPVTIKALKNMVVYAMPGTTEQELYEKYKPKGLRI